MPLSLTYLPLRIQQYRKTGERNVRLLVFSSINNSLAFHRAKFFKIFVIISILNLWADKYHPTLKSQSGHRWLPIFHKTLRPVLSEPRSRNSRFSNLELPHRDPFLLNVEPATLHLLSLRLIFLLSSHPFIQCVLFFLDAYRILDTVLGGVILTLHQSGSKMMRKFL